MSIHKRKIKSGIRYHVQYRDPNGRQVSKTFCTQREAIAFEAAELTRIRRREWIDPRLSEVSFSSWAKDWLECDPGKRETTKARDGIVVNLHLLPVFKSRPVHQITPMDVQKLVNAWAAGSAPNTVHRQYRTLAAIMRSAVNSDIIVKSPCRGIKLPKIHRKEARLINGDELEALGTQLGQFAPMAYLGALLGLRWGEVAGLRVKDLDLLNQKISVSQQVSRGMSGQPLVSQPKTQSSIRTLAMPDSLVERLAFHLQQLGMDGRHGDALIFADDNGGPLSYSNWRRRSWVPSCTGAGLSGLGFHDLRRANATVMVASGVDIKTAQRRMGHADPRMTLTIYAQATEQGDRSAADKLGNTFEPSHVDSMLTEPLAAEGAGGNEHPSTSTFTGGRTGTRTPDLCRVKAAL